VAEGSDHIQPSGSSREEILRDLEAAGLLRLLESRPSLRRARASHREAVPRPDLTRPRARPSRRLLGGLIICGLLMVLALCAYIAVQSQ
jgi:hypothetical protein